MRIHESLKAGGGTRGDARLVVCVRARVSSMPSMRCASMASIVFIDDTDRSIDRSIDRGRPRPHWSSRASRFGSSRSSRARGVAGDVVDVDGGRRRGNAREGCVDDVVVVVVVVGNVVVGDVVVERVVGDGGERVVGDERERVVDESAAEDGERARAR